MIAESASFRNSIGRTLGGIDASMGEVSLPTLKRSRFLRCRSSDNEAKPSLCELEPTGLWMKISRNKTCLPKMVGGGAGPVKDVQVVLAGLLRSRS